MKITDVLRAEHAVFRNLFDHIEQTLPRLRTLAEVRVLAAAMEKITATHSETEDELFITPLEYCFDQIGQKETFHHEHKIIDDLLTQVQKSRNLRTAKKILLSAAVASRKHCDKEERTVFPMAETILKAKTLNELGSTWLKRRPTATGQI